VLAAAAVVAACATPGPALSHAVPSAETAAAAVLEAFAAGDLERLRELALAEGEFRRTVWPELPASRPERNLPFSYVWGDLRQKSEQHLARLAARHRGQGYTLVSVHFGGQTAYDGFVVHRASTFVVRDATDAELALRLCGSLIERDGHWKVFSYAVDD
jgi:hypothetical protein